jgi:diaminohydroxyphosphoribosylaminopyrimidine deaminase / 5-amino-6-(5-phosphoribosylamino)uracil reductase
MTDSSMINNLMKEAIATAEKARSFTLPNPRVGAVIFNSEGKIIGRGYHKSFGGAHAETEAINDVLKNGNSTAAASLCVTLEPCNHYGKTGPCTKALLESGIKSVYIGTVDDNSCVCGGGLEVLRKAGISVKTGILEEECRKINPGFHKYNSKKLPFTNLKIALSLDGRVGLDTWFTGEKARKCVHQMRLNSDFILTGLGTVSSDDPMFNARLTEGVFPRRIGILDTGLKLLARYEQADLNVVKSGNEVFIITAVQDLKVLKKLEEAGLKPIVCGRDKSGMIDLRELIKKLGEEHNIREILIEGGSRLMTSSLMLEKDFLDMITFFVAPLWFGKGSLPMFTGEAKDFPEIKINSVENLDDAVMVQGEIR